MCERFALAIALLCLRFVARGDHSFVFHDRIQEAAAALKALQIYYPKKASRP